MFESVCVWLKLGAKKKFTVYAKAIDVWDTGTGYMYWLAERHSTNRIVYINLVCIFVDGRASGVIALRLFDGNSSSSSSSNNDGYVCDVHI